MNRLWDWLFRKKGTRVPNIGVQTYKYHQGDPYNPSTWPLNYQPKENTMTSHEQDKQGAKLYSRGNARFTAKAIIKDLATKQQYLTADDVSRELVALGFSLSDLGNAAGSIFRGNEYVNKIE